MTENLVPPVKVGDELKIKVEAIGSKGDGIAKIDKFILFVKKAELGKEYDVKVEKVFNNYAFSNIKQ